MNSISERKITKCNVKKSKNKIRTDEEQNDRKKHKQEVDEYYAEIQNTLKSGSCDKKNLEQKIELAWFDTKKDFANLIRQKTSYNKILLFFNKSNYNIKNDIVRCMLDNILVVCTHEYSKQFVLVIAKENKKNLVTIIKKLMEVCRELIYNRNGIYVLDEIYKMCNRKCRNEFISIILSTDKNITKDDETVNLGAENLIKKLSSKRLWKYTIAHHLLSEFVSINKDKSQFVTDLLQRNKQINSILTSYKGLDACLKLLEEENGDIFVKLIFDKFEQIVNNEYGVVFVMKLMEQSTHVQKIIDVYVSNYKAIFVEDVSVLPLIYVFNKEKKYFPTLFNQLRSNKTSITSSKLLIDKFKPILLQHLSVFMRSFTWILVYFFCKKDADVKKQTTDIISSEVHASNECVIKLTKKLKKYKIIK